MDQIASVFRIHPQDNVLVARRDLAAGESVGTDPPLTTGGSIPLGHKLASRLIGPGEPVLKYGQSIGIAKSAIAPGQWVHVHNVDLDPGVRQYQLGQSGVPSVRGPATHFFHGYRRASGKVGTRNYLAVISSVNCSASVSKAIARYFTAERLRPFANVDGVVAFTHHGGCAMQFNGLQHKILNRVLGGIARHPNIGGYVLIGLGCEKATLDFLIEDQRLVQIESVGRTSSSPGPPTLTMQAIGGTAKTIEAGIRSVEQLLPIVNEVQREPVPASDLVLATQCGGSDGNSGLTANPAVGVACDLLIDQGGTAILGETTEIVGAEHLLTRRAVNAQVAERLLEKVAWWKWYAGLFGETIDDNRSAGNAAGGLTTIAEKSLGAIAKGGSRPLVAVVDYAEPVTTPGLVFMDSPGFDPASTTGMVAGGANLVVFTTGRGSCFGCKPSPTVKIATNTPMFRRMEADMDLDAGRILTGTPVTDVGQEILQMILDVASGRPTKSEAQGIGDEEFVPWMVGPVL
jgi:altronate hydrolase